MRYLSRIMVLGFLFLFLFSCVFITEPGKNVDGSVVATSVGLNVDTGELTDTINNEKMYISFDETFVFNELEITFYSEGIEWYVVDSSYGDLNGSDVFCIKMTVKNISDETHGLNMFYYKRYGSKGTELDSLYFYYEDDVARLKDMRSGAIVDTKMYFLYDGDGDYFLEFSKIMSEKVEVQLPISKP